VGPTIRLAIVSNRATKGAFCEPNDPSELPSVLVSAAYLKNWNATRHQMHYKDWSLDSGAFTAEAAGKALDLSTYIDLCRRLLESDETLTEVFALDVIGDPWQSMKNADAMWRAGIPAIPTYHYGSPIDGLVMLAQQYPKIALGGAAKLPKATKMKWAGACFKKLWKSVGPVAVHGFGFGGSYTEKFPWHSVDASSWEIRPAGFGSWVSHGGRLPRVVNGNMNLRTEVLAYMRMQRKARFQWRNDMTAIRQNVIKRFGDEGSSGS
jgi:hypothetical protein